jgi:glycerol-3-phosphate dehydrogenase
MNREAQLPLLQKDTFDILVVGGGATGAGIALDAVSRGLKTALVEKDDYAAGTSSRSTKLIHGGVRYLERAVLGLDFGEYALVKEALRERSILLKLAPHHARYIPLLTPLYHRWEVPYYVAGLKMYDWLSGDGKTPKSRYVSKREALLDCPMLKPENLRGGVVYYDGQFNDARMNLSIVQTASELGAVVANHVETLSLTKKSGKITGALVRDTLAGKSFEIQARCVVNATGPASDWLRKLDDPSTADLLKASSGAHIVLDRSFSAKECGLLIPKTEDGRVLFLLPWLGHTLVGTTDNPAAVEADPKATAEDVQYILRQLKKYFSIEVTQENILSKWSGLRPLVQTHSGVSTAKLSREHFVDISPSGLLTIAGGKWTTYRKMAVDAVDEAVKAFSLPAKGPSRTETISLAGGAGFKNETEAQLEKEFGWDAGTAKYFNRSYGDRFEKVAEIIRKGKHQTLVPHHPYVEAEVLYAIRFESARTSMDILARRLRLAFLDKKAALLALPKVNELLAAELGWSEDEKSLDKAEAVHTLG